MDFDVSYAAALLAGLLSFASPCVLPLVPAYLGFIGGVTLDQIAGDAPDPAARRRVVGAAAAFSAGFGSVFVALGATASAIGALVVDHLELLSLAAGILVIAFGLHFLGALRLPFLLREVRHHPARLPSGPAGAFLVGLAFGFGWTPCVGPVLATILTLAASEEDLARGALLLAVYALGLGVPFVLAAAFAGSFLGLARRLRPHARRIEAAAGLLLVATGVAILTGWIAEAGWWLLRAFPALGRIG